MGGTALRAAGRPIREVNREIQEAIAAGNEVTVEDPRSTHNLGVALPEGGRVRFMGSVGYYCGGLNNGSDVTVHGNAGWGAGESMRAGSILVEGYAGLAAGATMCGGLVRIKGDTGPRCGVGMKGGTIIVEGRIGYQSGFMAHAGKIIALGGADDACADSLWAGEVWIAGEIKSLGVDSKTQEPTAEEVSEIEGMLAGHGLADSSREWRKVVSERKLWHFESRDAAAWLMI